MSPLFDHHEDFVETLRTVLRDTLDTLQLVEALSRESPRGSRPGKIGTLRSAGVFANAAKGSNHSLMTIEALGVWPASLWSAP